MLTESTLKFILEIILEYANDVRTSSRCEFNDGKRLAYYEILNAVNSQLIINDVDPKEYGLDFVIEDIL